MHTNLIQFFPPSDCDLDFDSDWAVFEASESGLVRIEPVLNTTTELLEEEIVDNPTPIADGLQTPLARGRVADRRLQLAAPLKKTKNPSAWKVNDAKVKRHLGIACTSKEGKHYPAKTIRPSCGKSCKFKCDTKVTEEDRLYFKDRYYSKNANQSEKWLFITSYTLSKPVGKNGSPNPKKKIRTCHNEFFLEKKKWNESESM